MGPVSHLRSCSCVIERGSVSFECGWISGSYCPSRKEKEIFTIKQENQMKCGFEYSVWRRGMRQHANLHFWTVFRNLPTLVLGCIKDRTPGPNILFVHSNKFQSFRVLTGDSKIFWFLRGTWKLSRPFQPFVRSTVPTTDVPKARDDREVGR